MTETIYRKLVRDNIPEIIEQGGKTPIWYALNDIDFKTYLSKKMKEEVEELIRSIDEGCSRPEIISEMADIIEVLDEIKSLLNIDEADVNNEVFSKRQERGGFNRRIFLDRVSD